MGNYVAAAAAQDARRTEPGRFNAPAKAANIFENLQRRLMAWYGALGIDFNRDSEISIENKVDSYETIVEKCCFNFKFNKNVFKYLLQNASIQYHHTVPAPYTNPPPHPDKNREYAELTVAIFFVYMLINKAGQEVNQVTQTPPYLLVCMTPLDVSNDKQHRFLHNGVVQTESLLKYMMRIWYTLFYALHTHTL